MRVGIIALLQESNTFSPIRTERRHFEQDLLLVGEEVRERFTGGHHEVSGFLAELAGTDFEVVPIFAGRALPFGEIAADAWRELTQTLFDAVEQSEECDGYLVAAHGAMVSQEEPDADGAWLAALRNRLGPTKPIIGTLDPHANLSPRMLAACDALVAYRTNPHIDQFECGRRAASLMVRTLRGEITPTQAAAFPPLAINIEQQETSKAPCRQLFQLADNVLKRAGVLSNSVLLGFAYADVAEMGSSMLMVTDDQPALAQQYADELAQYLWDRREEFNPHLTSIEQALSDAESLDGRICLLDMGDNVGGGSPADSTWLVHALHQRRGAPAVACLCDPAAVKQCEGAGVGATLRLRVGGHSGPSHGEPFEAEVVVCGLYDGMFSEPEPRHGGYSEFDQGRTAVVSTSEGLTLLINSQRMAPFSLAQLTSCGVDPMRFRLLVAKGVVAPIAAYRSVCQHFIRVNTRGITTADLATLPYQRRRRPLYPFEPDFDWDPSKRPAGPTR